MFYSHEVLTSRKYGVATVWLVATLGSKSCLKRIHRKQILDVDVVKACQTIVDPVAPMALRLQSNLLYGVSRVYLQQCGYVLSDAQHAHNAMVLMLRTVKDHALDVDAGKARPEQLVLQDDPSFLPSIALPPPELLADLDLALDFQVTRSGESQSLTPFGTQQQQQQSQSSSSAGELCGLVLPTSSPVAPGSFRLIQSGDEAAADIVGFNDGDDGLDLGDPGFGFDENGELIEDFDGIRAAQTPAARSGAGVHSDADASARVRREHEEGRAGGAQLPNDPMDLDLPILGDDLPEGEAFNHGVQDHPGSDVVEVVQSSSVTSAPMRKTRAPRVLPVDTKMELRNKDLSDWNSNYLKNMDAAIKTKNHSRIAQRAKKEAEYYVWGRGIGGMAEHLSGGTNPFHIFAGDSLFELATGVRRKKGQNTKRSRHSSIDGVTQEASRRVRQKTSDVDAEKALGLDDDEGFSMPGGDEVELPRDAPPALSEQQIFSSMPWNTGSKQGSSAIPRSGRPGSRMVSASPLHGRGQPLASDMIQGLESDADFAMRTDEFAGGAGFSSSAVEAPFVEAQVKRVNEALDAEGNNFLEFVADAIAEKGNRVQAMAGEGHVKVSETISFAELLPPANNKMIACQGLMMVLSLGTKGLLDVEQPEDFGTIHLKLTGNAKPGHDVDLSGTEDSGDEQSSDGDVEIVAERGVEEQSDGGEEGYFEEQFVAGHVNDDD
ncbi:R8 protein [Pleosporales sp. CAS-2024a]